MERIRQLPVWVRIVGVSALITLPFAAGVYVKSRDLATALVYFALLFVVWLALIGWANRRNLTKRGPV